MAQFIDHVFIEASSGDGGDGAIAWRREKYEPMGGPAGGNGGRGGHVFVEATNDLNTLLDFRFNSKFKATPGMRGRSKGMHGKAGEDMVIRVPAGTVVKDAETGDTVADLVKDGQRIMVAEGGKGGRGNAMLASPTRRAPHFCEPGQKGITRQLELELKILADVGIIGLPNAGKSTLLSVVSKAKPKIADYPFSTLEPTLGVVQTPDGESSFVMADIPGLIEGASQGIGLGHKFLRHVERTRILIHLVDGTSEHIEKDVKTINEELTLYSEKLARLPQILVLNKADVITDEEIEPIKKKLEGIKGSATDYPLLVISAATRLGVDNLLKLIQEALSHIKKEEPEPVMMTMVDPRATERNDEGFTVTRKRKAFFIEGDRVERIVNVTDLRSPESLHHLHHVLRAMGVIDELLKQGATAGSEVWVGKISFAFGEEFN